MAYVDQVQGSSVNWGGMVAGAAAATGAVMLSPAFTEQVGDSIPEALSSIASAIKSTVVGWFASPEAAEKAADAVKVPAEKGLFEGTGALLKDFGSFIKGNAKELAGATLVGGGVAGLMTSGGEKAYVVKNHPLTLAHSHVENEQMRAINGLMKARMMAANPEYMAQAMGRA